VQLGSRRTGDVQDSTFSRRTGSAWHLARG
jgi:hypothetical protein